VGLGSTAAVDAEVAALAAKREATFLTGEEAKRMEALLEARSKLVDIEKSINDERDRAAEQAARDQERAEAEARVAAEKAAANAELQKTLQLELAIAEARASKDTQEEGKLQFVKDYQAALERARQAGIEGNEAFDFAQRSANAEATQRNQGDAGELPQSEQASNEPLFSSSLAKIGGGGGIAGAPGLLDENKKQTNILQSLADVSKSVLPEISNRLAGIFSDKPAEPAARKEGPSPTLQSPEVPSLKAPTLQSPEVPSLKAPTLQSPEFPSLKAPTLQSPEVPSLKAPTLQSPEVPSLKAPTLQSPEVPSLKAPRLQAPQIPPMEPLPIIPPPAIEPTKAIGGFDLQSRLDQSNVKGAFEKDKISSALYQEARLQTNFLRQIAQRLGNLNPTPLLA
jgi:hypothetical protein